MNVAVVIAMATLLPSSSGVTPDKMARTDVDANKVSDTEGHSEKEFAVHAQELFLLDTAYPQEAKSLQVTLRGMHMHSSPDEHESELALQLEYGLTDRVQIELELPYQWVKRTDDEDEAISLHGLGDIEFGVLGAITPQDSPLTVSLALGIRVPTAEDDLGEDTAAEPSVLAAWDLREIILHANIGAELASGEQALGYGFAIERPHGPFSFIAELAGESEGDGTTLMLTPGVSWHPSEAFEISVGVPIGLNDDAADWGIIGVITVEF